MASMSDCAIFSLPAFALDVSVRNSSTAPHFVLIVEGVQDQPPLARPQQGHMLALVHGDFGDGAVTA
jgi:hypothetical protein